MTPSRPQVLSLQGSAIPPPYHRYFVGGMSPPPPLYHWSPQLPPQAEGLLTPSQAPLSPN